MPRRESREPDDEPSDVTLLQRYVERPGGRVELLEIPLTPEDFLNPRYGDKWLQGRTHSDVTHELTALLKRHFGSQPDVVVMSDVQHRFGPGLDEPSPDVSVIPGVRDPRAIESSFDLQKVGVLPCLLVEVVSPRDSRIRRVDEETKVGLYQRVGIPEYLLVRPPRPEEKNQPFRLWGYRLASDRRYRPIEPDEKGQLLSETTGLWFAVSPAGDRIEVFDVKTGERLRTLLEEVEARKAAEEELARLQAEIVRLKGSTG